MKVTGWSDKLYQWIEYAEVLCPLRDEVSDIFATKYIWDEKCQCTEKLYEADNDTVFLLKLSEMLNEICDFVKSHIRSTGPSGKHRGIYTLQSGTGFCGLV